MLSGWKYPRPTHFTLSTLRLPGSSRERDEGVAVLVLHVVRVEAVRPKGPGVGPDEVVVVKVDDVYGAHRARGQRHALHSGWLGEAAGDHGHGAVQPHRFLDHHGQVVQSGQVSPAATYTKPRGK